MASHEPILGIDLSDGQLAAVVMRGKGERMQRSLPTALDGPAIVHVALDGRVCVGRDARVRAVSDPAGVAARLVQALGATRTAAPDDSGPPMLPAPRIDPSGPQVEVRGVEWSATSLVGCLLARIRQGASDWIGRPVSIAAIAYPTWYGAAARDRVVLAAHAAGFEQVHTLPSAAAIATALHDSGVRGTVGLVEHEVASIGAALIDLSDEAIELERMGGRCVAARDDLLVRTMRFLAAPFEGELVLDASARPRSAARFRAACEDALAELRARPKEPARVSVPYLALAASGPRQLDAAIDGDRLRELARPLLGNFEEELASVLKGTPLDRISRWLVVGGAPSVTFAAQALRARSAREVRVDADRTPWGAVGACIHGARREGDLADVFLLQVASHAIGVRNPDGGVLRFVDRFAPLPATVSGPYPVSALGRQPVELIEGEVDRAELGTSLASFRLATETGPRNDFRRIELVVEVSTDGALAVGVRAPGSLETIVLERVPGVTPAATDVAQELDRLLDAQREYEGLLRARWALDAQVLAGQRLLGEGRLRGTAASESDLADAIARGRNALASTDLDRIQQAARSLAPWLRQAAPAGVQPS